MNTSGKTRHTSTVSHSDKKYHKRICFNKKSFTSMFLSAALLLTSVDCMHVQAEEMADQVPPVLTEEVPENQETVSGNTLAQEEGMAAQDFVKTEAGAVIITSFVPLDAKKSRLLLDKAEGKLSLEEVTRLLPTELKANATVYVSEDSGTEDGKEPTEGEQLGTETGDGQQPTEGEGEQPGAEEGDDQQPTEGEGEQPGTEEGDDQQPTEGEQPGTETGDGQQPTEGEGEQPGTEEGDGQQSTEGERPETGAGDDQSSTEGEQSVTGQEQSGAEESHSETSEEEPETNDVAVAESNRTYAAESGHQWRLLVAAETGLDGVDTSENNEAKANESESGNADNAGGGNDISGAENNSSTDEGTNDGDHVSNSENNDGTSESGSLDDHTSDGEDGGTAESGNADGSTSNEETGIGEGGAGDGTGSEDGTGAGEDEPVVSTKEVDVEIPVQWVCEDDYENTELTEYTFRPTWDKTAWFYEAGETSDSVPSITVSYVDVIKEEVSTEEELAVAFATGVNKITMTADIALTATLRLPATADIELDGQGHSLLRGEEENEPFIGTMISMDGDDYTEETYGMLTLKSITVDGKTPADRAGAPVILDRGSLILEEDAVVRDNYNYGTYPSDEEEHAETILDYGGGIQVYGELSVAEESLVTGNFADEFGGGVYLADGATLYLYADVIRENSVSEDAGYGADLYAAGGSTIYYDSSVDMERDGFYLCDGVTLICMQGQDAVSIAESDRHDEKVEIYISAAEGSGYDDSFLETLRDKLETEHENYTVIPTRAEVDISDSRDWYVYDHYDTSYWGSTPAGETAPEKWQSSSYGNNPKRTYYPYTEGHCYSSAVDTIAAWLECRDTQYMSDGSYRLARFREHIYNPPGKTDMTFVGYGTGNYVDFMFYDPQSKGEKMVDFDIDSSKVISHALAGMGFLVNTGVKDGNSLNGYLIYYHYNGSKTSPGDNPSYLYVCKLNGVDIETFHGQDGNLKTLFGSVGLVSESLLPYNLGMGIEIIKSVSIPSDWSEKMSIRIKVSPTRIEIWQKSDDTTPSTSTGTQGSLVVPIEDSGYSGFGPLVAYTSSIHTGCTRASCFTYSDLHMYYTKPESGKKDMLRPLELADYTQEGTRKYFLNLFGNRSDLEYNMSSVETDFYQDFLKLMQIEGIALITDRETPFEEYLGKSGEARSNLCEIGKKGDGALTVDALAEKISAYIDVQDTTYIQHKLQPDEDEGLKIADPRRAVGNIWLENADGKQIRETLEGESFTGDGYRIQIKDDGIAYYHEDGDEGKDQYTVIYEILNPDGETIPDATVTCNASDSVVPSFVVGMSSSKWPSGRYTVRQTIKSTDDSKSADVLGYAYFDLKRKAVEVHEHKWSDDYRTETKATCTTEGWEVKYCTICGEAGDGRTIPETGHSPEEKWSTDADGHWKECVICHTPLNREEHKLKDGWSTDTTGHWRECTVCNAVIGKEEHKPKDGWSTDADGHWCECTICKQEIGKEGHSISEEWSTDTDSHWRECTVCHVVIGKERHSISEEWSTDTDGHWKECTVCHEVIGREVHSISEEWSTDADGHWKECTVCHEVIGKAGHSISEEWSTDADGHWRECVVCHEVIGREVHSPGEEWSTDADSHWKECTVCNEVIGKEGHSKKGEWSTNEIEHWHVCDICIKKLDIGFHKFGAWITEEEATEDKDGSKYRACTDCGYKERDSIVRGKITKREDCGASAPQTEISTELPALALAVLVEDDVHAVGNGTDITIVLTVEDAGNTVSTADREAVTSTAKSYKLGQYFDVNLYKEMNGGKSQVTETSDEIRLSIEVPEQFRKTARKYAVVRVHNGEAVILKDLDTEDSTVTIDTDRFSTYAFVYADRAKESEKKNKPDNIEEGPSPEQTEDDYVVTINYQNQKEATPESQEEAGPESQKDSEPRTGETTHFELYATVAFINGASYLYFLFGGRRGMTEETKTELVSRLIRWAKRGGKIRRWLALAVIFLLLVYYHSIGKKVSVEWRQVCGE